MTRQTPSRKWLRLGLLAPLVLTGCGSSASVSGRVLYKGQPLKAATVTFVTEDNHTYSSPIGQDGTYTIPKIRPGPVKIGVHVTVLPKFLSGPFAKGNAFKNIKPPEGLSPDAFKFDKNPSVPIPARYSNPEKSGLVYTVEPGAQDHDIVVPADEKKRK